MASKVEYQDLEVKGTVKANEFADGVLKNSGFEVVSSLPTSGLFAGRQVFYKGQEYIYNGTVWCNQLDPLQKLYIPWEVYLYTLEQLNSKSQVIQLANYQISQIPELLAGRQWTSVFSQTLRKSEFDCEIKRGDADWVNYEWLFWDNQYRDFSEGTEIRITTHNLTNFANNSLTQAFFLNCDEANNVVELTIEYLSYKNLSGDNDINNEANYEWRPIFKKELRTATSWVFPAQVFVKTGRENVYAKDIRLTLRVVSGHLYVNGLDFYLQTQKGQTVGTTPFLINYDSAINPTQKGEVFKTNKWILQYLTQGINWLKAKLANGSMSLNSTTVKLGDTAILPWYVNYNEVDYPARVRDNWLQIYRNGVWGNLVYLSGQEAIQPTQIVQITSFDNLDWYNEQVSEYEVDNNTTQSILAGTTLPAAALMNCLAEQLTLNFYPISGKKYGKGSLDSLIGDLQGKGFAVFVENDLDAILSSGSDYLVRIKICKVPTAKAIIECYVSR